MCLLGGCSRSGEEIGAWAHVEDGRTCPMEEIQVSLPLYPLPPYPRNRRVFAFKKETDTLLRYS